MENCVYMFVRGLIEVLYVGKAKNLNHRLNNHSHLPNKCYEETEKILYYSFNTEGDMELAERYFISKYKPVYNDRLLKKDITMEIENFNKLKFEEYENFKKITKKNSFLRDLEPYIKNNSYEMYTTKSGKRCYRVSLDFIEELSEMQGDNKINMEYNCCESMKKFGKEFDMPSWSVFSMEENDDYCLHLYCEVRQRF
ncbi:MULTISPECIES: GIY-YIG nuclease family protein [unclassified Clostridioides]|uniref:GIY-YIG nuclease family protein n=1 Tax=unclassified Clostridioides TaxID=2635829 RepID=UPI001D12E15E|nr:GIY-YIG nuclease family protein [Clostridioides sp. ZZV14-6045]MCC0732628.1 GIY-YIG nuclease family protein [Clostridioides sp. ZZV14-6048]MCC0740557.1 GIY-YIG nuclease family protein [Clostridioides sp. ZZV14-5902]